jgi:hypothetical protein
MAETGQLPTFQAASAARRRKQPFDRHGDIDSTGPEVVAVWRALDDDGRACLFELFLYQRGFARGLRRVALRNGSRI